MNTDGVGGVALLGLVAIVPIVILMLTSFVKISVVLALLRNALGAPDAPSGLVVMGVSLVLTFFVMAPVAVDMARAAASDAPIAPSPSPSPSPAPGSPGTQAPSTGASGSAGAAATAPALGRRVTGDPVDPYTAGAPASSIGAEASAGAAPSASTTGVGTGSVAGSGSGSGSGSATAPGAPGAASSPVQPLDLDAAMRELVPARYRTELDAAQRALPPLSGFLARHAAERDRGTFVELSRRMGRDVRGDELWVLAPAFLTTELREAFAIAVLVFLPFLVIDLVVGLGLGALGLSATQPQVVALPLKLLLFVAVDGWRLLIDGLLRGYV